MKMFQNCASFYILIISLISINCKPLPQESDNQDTESRKLHIFTCPDQLVSSQCINSECTVICSDGIKVSFMVKSFCNIFLVDIFMESIEHLAVVPPHTCKRLVRSFSTSSKLYKGSEFRIEIRQTDCINMILRWQTTRMELHALLENKCFNLAAKICLKRQKYFRPVYTVTNHSKISIPLLSFSLISLSFLGLPSNRIISEISMYLIGISKKVNFHKNAFS